MQKRISILLEHFLWRSWWVILFILACSMLFEHAIFPQRLEHTRLIGRLNELHEEKSQALHLQEDLLRRVNSESDPAWIELTLKKGLGLSPEDQTKVFFTTP